MSAERLYDHIKTDLEHLEREQASRSEWLAFSHRVVDAIMKCQAIVLEHQKQLMAHARAGTSDEYKASNQAVKDAIQILDKLSAIHDRTRTKLAGLSDGSRR